MPRISPSQGQLAAFHVDQKPNASVIRNAIPSNHHSFANQQVLSSMLCLIVKIAKTAKWGTA